MKKTLAMLLVLVLMLSLVSVAAFADKAVTLNVVTSVRRRRRQPQKL